MVHVKNFLDLLTIFNTMICHLSGFTLGIDLKPVPIHYNTSELPKCIFESILWSILFANDSMLVAKTRDEINARLEDWRVTH